MKKMAVCGAVLACLSFLFSLCTVAEAATKLIDDFGNETNLLGGKANAYEQSPSKILFKRIDSDREGRSKKALMLKYDKQSKGGPYDSGGWCGYYTLLKVNDKYFDASGYKSLTLWVKGAKGDESFKVGLADKEWDKKGDSLKSDQIGAYLPSGKISTGWQKAVIPMSSFFLDYKELLSVSICFESDCFNDGSGSGTIYIADIAFE